MAESSAADKHFIPSSMRARYCLPVTRLLHRCHDSRLDRLTHRLLRELESEAGADSDLAGDLDAAAMQGDNALHDRQPQPDAASVLGSRGVNPVESLEQPRKMFGRYSAAGVTYLNANRAVSPVGAELNRAATRCVS